MMSQSSRVRMVLVQSDTPSRWVFPAWLSLLAVAILINYVDRGNLAVAAPLLKDELHLTNTQVGVLVTSFFWTYTLVMAISGWIVDRFNVNWVLAVGFVVWSVATALTGFAHAFAFFMFARMLLGVGESVAFPSFTKIVAANIPQQRRGVANAVILSGMSLGPAVGTLACGMSMARFGWRPVFICIGLVSLLWIVPWLRYMPRNKPDAERKVAAVTVFDIVRQRNFWAASIGHFCSNYPLYFLIVWLPLYLVRERHLTMQQMAMKATAYYLAFAAVAPIAGWIADKLVRAGRDVTKVRKSAMAIGHALTMIGVLMAASADERVWMAGLVVMGVGGGFVGPNIYVFAQTLSGAPAAGKWIGLQNSLSNFAGIVVGPLTGWIVDRTGHFSSAFSICAVASLLGGLFWVVGVTRVEQIEWAAKPEVLAAAAGEAA